MYRNKATQGLADKEDDNYWSKLTDDQLLKAALIANDHSQFGALETTVPAGKEPVYVETFYTSDVEVKCVHGHNHKRGFIMNKGGKRFPVGWRCGETIYGAHFKRLVQHHKAARSRQQDLVRARAINAALDPFEHWLADFRGSPVFDHYQAIRLQLVGVAPWLNDQLKIRCWKHGGRLTVTNRIRDGAAEAKDRERYLIELKHHRDGNPTPIPPRENIFREEEATLHTLRTLTLFAPNTDPRQKFTETANGLEILLRRLRRSLKDSENPYEIIALIRERLTIIDSVIAMLAEAEQFFQPETLSAVAEWANRHDNSKREYSAGLNYLQITIGTQQVSLQMLPTFKLPSKEPLGAFRASLADLR